ncbi:23S rRNA (uracil(1939)-C(5))-methyltransferase RlmD [Candidatus Uhrbacteria bacterium]|nr:23S rRNA (uracil(1939)-C(5))-methyltransferase RlmD [Candidatus Uhrbacteria bacterium]
MRFGHRVQGTIESYDDKGRGIFELRGTDGSTLGAGTAAIPFTAKGDEITAIFTQRDHGTKICKLETLEKPSPERVAAPCPHAGVCGGCLWQHLRYEAQLDLKRDAINSAFEKSGHEERVQSVVPCPIQFHHRNRMDYAVGWNGEIGLKEYGAWSKYVDVKTCLLLDDGAGEILQHVRDWMRESDLQPWDAKFFNGDIRYVVVREGKNTKQRLIVIVVHDLERVRARHTSTLRERLSPLCTSLLIGEQNLQTDISLAQKFETLIGEPWLEEVVGDIRYRIHPNSFFQTNSLMAGELQKCVLSYVIPRLDRGNSGGSPAFAEDDNKKNILDLYCGLGFFGIYLAKNLPAVRVQGFELDEPAIELAKFNAKQNGVADRCEFFAGKAEDLSWKDVPADAVILDPPRSGLHPKVLKTILEMKPPTIVYVSCNYHRLVEELKQFKTIYKVEDIKAFDLFPHTPHVEVVAKITQI